MMKYLDLDGARYIVATIQNLLDGKVSKDGSKVLSTNDYTTTEKNKLAGIAASATKVETSTTIGNLKINGAEKQIIPLMSAASSSAAGKAGLVPAPAQNKHTSFLRGDGTWVIPTNTTYTNATTSKDGLMSSEDKIKLNSIAEGANKYVHPTTSGYKHIPTGGSAGQVLKWSADGVAVWGTDNNTTYSNMIGASSSAAGKSGLVPAPAAGANTKYLRGDGTWQTPPNTTYSLATSSSNGLLSSGDFTKLSKVTATEMGYLDGVTSPIQTQLNSKANTSNVLTKNNTASYTPTNDYHPATKKYVDENSGSKFNGVYELTRDSGDTLTFYINIPNLTDPSVLEGKVIHIYVATEMELSNNQKVIINSDENNYMYFNPTHLLGGEIYAATVEKAFQDETKYLFDFGRRMGKNIIKDSQMPMKTLNPNESASFSFGRTYMGKRWCFLFFTPKATGQPKSKMKVEVLLDGTAASSYTREYTFDDEGILNQGTELIPLRFTSSYDKKKIEVKATCISGQIKFPSRFGTSANSYPFTGAFIETKNQIFGSSEYD